ncbi:MAG TPA: SCO2322 family protein, partial [Nocardioidaceae bacterium]
MLPRRIVGTLSTLLLALLVVTGTAGTAHAEDGYQYWNYFHLQKGSWTFSKVGAGDYTPADGAVEGFRFGTSTQSQGIEPRADLDKVDFEAICGTAKAPTGKKRVAVVLDFGAEMGKGQPPAPRADCAVVAKDASTQQVLEEVADLRVGSGMVCAIDGYPATGC